MSLVVTSKIKQAGKSVGLRVSQEFIDALSKRVMDLVISSATAAKADKRQTIKARDL